MRRVGTFGAVFGLAFAALSINTTGALATTSQINTAAGTGVAGYSGDSGQATSAQLSTPAGVTVDGAGNVYVADDGSNVVRKIQTSGVITTVAGTGVAGYSGNGGAATSAMLNGPTDVVLDPAGNLYIADDGNHVVRKVTPGGTISTVAGTGVAGYSGDGHAATAAKLMAPVGLDVDTSGNLFIADYGNGTVRKVSTTGTITTVAGTGTVGYSGDGGPATAAELSHPGDVATVGSLIYIADGGNARVRVVSAAGTISTVAGDGTVAYAGDGGQATAASLMFPTGLAADSSGNLFISDFSAAVIREVAVGGTISTVAGTGVAGYSGDGGAATSAQLSGPARVNLDAAGDLYISDWSNSRLRTVSLLGSAANAPDAPTAVSATAGDTTADLTWTAPVSDGGSPITGYTVTPNNGTTNLTPVTVSAATTATTVTGLTDGTTYTFTVTATNSVGDSTPSTASTPITPLAPPPAPAPTPTPSAPTPTPTPTAPTPTPTATAPTPQPTQSSAPTPAPTQSTPTTPPASTPATTTPQDNTSSTPAVQSEAPVAAPALSASAGLPVGMVRSPHHRPRHHAHRSARIPAALSHGTPQPTLTAPATHPSRHHRAVSLTWHQVRAALVAVSRKTAVPAGLLLLVGLFLSLQNRLDRRDPKLALAPVFADPGVSFVPAMS